MLWVLLSSNTQQPIWNCLHEASIFALTSRCKLSNAPSTSRQLLLRSLSVLNSSLLAITSLAGTNSTLFNQRIIPQLPLFCYKTICSSMSPSMAEWLRRKTQVLVEVFPHGFDPHSMQPFDPLHFIAHTRLKDHQLPRFPLRTHNRQLANCPQ